MTPLMSRVLTAAGKFVLGVLAGMAFLGIASLLARGAQLDLGSCAAIVVFLKVVVGLFSCRAAGWAPLGVGVFASIPLEFLIFVSICFQPPFI